MNKGAVYILVALFVIGVFAVGASAADGNSCNIFCKISNWFAAKPSITGAVISGSSDSYQILSTVAIAPEKQKTAKQSPLQKSIKPQPTPLVDVSERLFDVSSDDFNAKWKSPMLPPFMMKEVYEAGDGMIAEQTTDSAGAATFDVYGSGNFLLIAKYVWTDADGATQTSYLSSKIFVNAFKGDSNTATVKLFARKSVERNNPAIVKAKARWQK